MYRLVGGLGLPLLIVTVLMTVWRSDNRGPEAGPEIEANERAGVAAEGRIVTLPGAQVDVASEVTGRIQMFQVKEGDWVNRGDTIAVLDQSDALARMSQARAELAIAQAQLVEVAAGSRVEEIRQADAALAAATAERTLAERDLERYRLLYSKDEVSRASLEERERTFQVALNSFKGAEQRQQLLASAPRPETRELHQRIVDRSSAGVEYFTRLLEKSVIKAPISGKLIRKNVEVGEVVYAEHPVAIATVSDIKRIEINAEVDETDIGKVTAGAPVEIAGDAYPGGLFRGTVREIADYVGPRAATPNNPARNVDMKVVQVRITLPSGAPFRLGMTVNVRIETPPHDVRAARLPAPLIRP